MTAILPILPNLSSLPIRTSPPYGLYRMTDLPDTAPTRRRKNRWLPDRPERKLRR
jgi:hypothetical protein